MLALWIGLSLAAGFEIRENRFLAAALFIAACGAGRMYWGL